MAKREMNRAFLAWFWTHLLLEGRGRDWRADRYPGLTR